MSVFLNILIETVAKDLLLLKWVIEINVLRQSKSWMEPTLKEGQLFLIRQFLNKILWRKNFMTKIRIIMTGIKNRKWKIKMKIKRKWKTKIQSKLTRNKNSKIVKIKILKMKMKMKENRMMNRRNKRKSWIVTNSN